MTYSPYTTVDKIIDSKKEPRDVIKFVNAQISGAFSITINNTNYIADNTFANMVGYVELTNSILNQKIIDNKLKVKIGARDVPFVIIDNQEGPAAGTTNKDNFGLTVVYQRDTESEEYYIRLYTREILTPGATINVSAVVLFENYIAHENENTAEAPLYHGITNGGGSGSGEDFEWTYNEESLSVFVDYFKGLVYNVQGDLEDFQDILDALSDSIYTGELEAMLVSAGTITADRLAIGSKNIFTTFDSFEEWRGKEIPFYVPHYLESTGDDYVITLGTSKEGLPSILGDTVMEFSYDFSFPNYRTTTDPLPEDISNAEDNIYYQTSENEFRLKKDTFIKSGFKHVFYYEDSEITESDQFATIVQIDDVFKKWNENTEEWENITSKVSSEKDRTVFAADPNIEYYLSNKTRIFYTYLDYEISEALPTPKISFRPTPKKDIVLVDGRKKGKPWINLSEGYYILSYYVTAAYAGMENIELNIKLISEDEIIFANSTASELTNSTWQREKILFHVPGETLNNYFYLEITPSDSQINYYIDGIQIERYYPQATALEEDYFPSDFSRGGKLLFDGSNLKTGSIAAEHAVFQEGTIRTADIEDAAITKAKIGTAQISNAHIEDATITSAKIATVDVGSLVAERADVETGVIQKIYADLIDVDNLFSDNSFIGNLHAQVAEISRASIDDLIAVDISALRGNIEDLTTSVARIDELGFDTGIGGELILKNLQLQTGNLKDVKIDFANIENVVIDSGHIKDGSISNVHISQAGIDAAKITNLTVDHLLVGDLEGQNANFSNLLTQYIETNALVSESLRTTVLSAVDSTFIQANIGDLDAGIITTGVLAVEQLVLIDPLNPEKSVLFELNKAKYRIVDSVVEALEMDPLPRFIRVPTIEVVNGVEKVTSYTYYEYNETIAEENKYQEIPAESVNLTISETQFDGANIAPETIYGESIISKSITTDHIQVIGGLSALTSDLGEILAGRLSSRVPENATERDAFIIDLDAKQLQLGDSLHYSYSENQAIPSTLTLKNVNIEMLANQSYRNVETITSLEDIKDSQSNDDVVYRLVSEEGEEIGYYIITESGIVPYTLASEIQDLKIKTQGVIRWDVFEDVPNPEGHMQQLFRTFRFTGTGLHIVNKDTTSEAELRLDPLGISFVHDSQVSGTFTGKSLNVENIEITTGEVSNSLTIGKIQITPENRGIESMNFLWVGG